MASRFLCLVFFRAAAVDWSEIFENQSPGRHLQSLPDGFEINQTMNGTIPLTVVPSWDIFLSFSDRQKYIKGRMSLATIYPEIATTFVEHPEHMVDVLNFGSGSGDINTMSSLKLWDPKSGKTATTVSKTYVGEFSQSLYPYDMSCYPFDRKTVHFQIGIQKPGAIFYKLVLGCVGKGSYPIRVDNDGAVRECSWHIGASYVGFEWDNFTCNLRNDATLNCEMTGTRAWSALLKTYIWPSIVYGLMGFEAFALGVKHAMPRVATTMLALLSLTSLRNQVIALVPASGATSWMEEYFLIAISFMFFNLIGHAASFHLDAIGRHHTQLMVNKFNLWAMMAVFVLVVLLRLHMRACPVMDPFITLALTLGMAAVTISIIVFLVWCHREAFREAGRKITEKALASMPSMHHMHHERHYQDHHDSENSV